MAVWLWSLSWVFVLRVPQICSRAISTLLQKLQLQPNKTLNKQIPYDWSTPTPSYGPHKTTPKFHQPISLEPHCSQVATLIPPSYFVLCASMATVLKTPPLKAPLTPRLLSNGVSVSSSVPFCLPLRHRSIITKLSASSFLPFALKSSPRFVKFVPFSSQGETETAETQETIQEPEVQVSPLPVYAQLHDEINLGNLSWNIFRVSLVAEKLVLILSLCVCVCFPFDFVIN